MEVKKPDVKSIISFWEWFSDNCGDFGQNFDNEELITELENQIAKLGTFSREIGPGNLFKNQLVISPGGDLGLLLCCPKSLTSDYLSV